MQIKNLNMTLTRPALVIPVLLAFVGVWLLFRPPREPQFEGKPLSHYLASVTYGELRTEREATEALHSIGAPAVPHLIAILEQRESRLKLAWVRLIQRIPWRPIQPVPLPVRQIQAALACQAIGPAANAAIPSLAKLVSDPALAGHAVSALAAIGQADLPVLALLTNVLLTGIPAARIEAAGDLRFVEAPERCIPALLVALHDAHATVRARAVDTLGVIRSQPDLIVPAIIPCLADPDVDVRRCAIRSLGWVGPAAKTALPSLIEMEQHSPDPSLHALLEEALRLIRGGSACIPSSSVFSVRTVVNGGSVVA
jgi:HEAT repeat protein